MDCSKKSIIRPSDRFMPVIMTGVNHDLIQPHTAADGIACGVSWTSRTVPGLGGLKGTKCFFPIHV